MKLKFENIRVNKKAKFKYKDEKLLWTTIIKILQLNYNYKFRFFK